MNEKKRCPSCEMEIIVYDGQCLICNHVFETKSSSSSSMFLSFPEQIDYEWSGKDCRLCIKYSKKV